MDRDEILNSLPEHIDVPAAWSGRALARDPGAWTERLGPEDVDELKSACDAFVASGLDIAAISPATFPLPRLGPRLERLRETLIHGLGFRLFRGLPVAEFSSAEIAAVYCGIGVHVGALRSQNADGHLLGRVRDTGADVDDPATRIYQTNARQTFHTDSSDAVALLCLNPAMEGGDSLLVSSVTLYNQLRARRPDLLPHLFSPVATDRRGEVPEGEAPYFLIPVFNWHAGRLTTLYHRTYIESAQRFDDAPRLSQAQREALDTLDALANDPELHLSMRLEPGDMQFVYNHTIFHDRTAFRDWPDGERRRTLFRLWLSLPGDRELPECFRQRYGSIAIGDRGGIVVSGTSLKVPVG